MNFGFITLYRYHYTMKRPVLRHRVRGLARPCADVRGACAEARQVRGRAPPRKILWAPISGSLRIRYQQELDGYRRFGRTYTGRVQIWHEYTPVYPYIPYP